jgi:hypothetical protein
MSQIPSVRILYSSPFTSNFPYKLKINVVLVNDMKAYAPLILNLGAGWVSGHIHVQAALSPR